MFAVIYRFAIHPEKEKEFLSAWEGLTDLIYKHEGSLGSRLHQQDAVNYIAYAQWPDKNTWKEAGDKLPKEANIFRDRMKESCSKIETLYELQMINDMLQTLPFNKY
jgi:heme-degrading monooxygenase HmoA